MPRAPRRCPKLGCDELVPCPTHTRERQRRPSGRYPASHQADREWWSQFVDAGMVKCRRGKQCRRHPDTQIHPGDRWDLGHPDAECSAPTAPEHEKCNRSAPGRLQRRS